MKRIQAITTYQLGKVYVFCALWETAVRTRIPKDSLPYALSFALCFTASKLFAVLISLHICSSMPMVHVYYLSKLSYTHVDGPAKLCSCRFM